jgi:hypothetical protein
VTDERSCELRAQRTRGAEEMMTLSPATARDVEVANGIPVESRDTSMSGHQCAIGEPALPELVSVGMSLTHRGLTDV